MRKPSISHIHLADFGAIDLAIPVLTYGSGRPTLSLVAGIHGDEVAGLFVIDKLMNELEDFAGQLRLIPSANPVAQALSLRASPRDNLDLNRIFPGRPDGQLPELIAYRLMKILCDSDVVIDFHSFGLKNPIMAIFADCGEEEVRQKSFEYICAFGPEMIWLLDIGNKLDLSYKGAMAPALAARGVPNFAIEMPANHRMTEEHVNFAVEGIKTVMRKAGMLSPIEQDLITPPMYRRSDVHVTESGLFYPLKEIMNPVEKGEVVGHLTSIRTFQSEVIKAPADGMLLQIHTRDFVTTGQSIFSMGIPAQRK